MAGYFHDIESSAGHFDMLAFADPHGGGGDAVVVGGHHRQVRPAFAQLGDTADVVVVVVGQQDGAGLQAFACRRQHRGGLAGIDDDRAAVVGDQRPDVVVAEGG